jgi:hypothetical protein
MIEKLWMVAILSFGLYWISPFIAVFTYQLINTVNWFNFHENIKMNIREIDSKKIDL